MLARRFRAQVTIRKETSTMPEYDLKTVLGIIAVASPALLVILLGVSSLLKWPRSEPTINRAVQAAILSGLLASIAILTLMLLDGTRHVVIDVGAWIEIPYYHFSIKFVFVWLAVAVVT